MNSSLYIKTRTYARNFVLDTFGLFAKPAPGIHILNGHHIGNVTEKNGIMLFRRVLDELSHTGVQFIRIEDAVNMIHRHEIAYKPLIAFTFDDGFMDCYDVFAPVLEEFGINACFFVNPNYVDGDETYIKNFNTNVVMTVGKRPMRWENIKRLSNRGHVIGAHTMDHYMINTDEISVIKHQIVDCKSYIENNIGKECEYFAFPYGKLAHANITSINIACDTYKHVFSQSDYKHYFSFNGRVINRRHFEIFWPVSHIKYFISCQKR